MREEAVVKRNLSLRVIKRLARQAGFWINEDCFIAGGHDDAIIKFADLLFDELNKRSWKQHQKRQNYLEATNRALSNIISDLEEMRDVRYQDIFGVMPITVDCLQDTCQEVIERIQDRMKKLNFRETEKV